LSASPGPGAAAAAPAGAPKAPGWSLRWRVASGVVFVPLLVLLASAGGLAWTAFVGLQVALGLHEFHRMMRAKGLAPFRTLAHLGALGMLAAAYRPHLVPAPLLATGGALLLLAFALRRTPGTRIVESAAVTLLGLVWIGWTSTHLVLLRELPWRAGAPYADGARFVLLAFFVTWACDTGAYAFGRAFGRVRPWTAISPRKSVEGALGGLAAAVAAGFVARAWFAPFLSPLDALALGLLAGVFAQVGDLVESLLKRDAGSGDSSDLIPGHGGILDRFDSLYFAAPLVHAYLVLAVFRVP